MLRFLVLSLLLSLCTLEATAAAVPKRAFPGHGWQRRWLAPRDGDIRLHIALRQEDGGAAVERQLLLASDPDSAGFRQHLGPGRPADLSSPAQGSVRNTEIWLQQHDLLRDASISGGMFEIDTTIRKAERLLNTTYFVYSDGTQEVTRTELYYIPDIVAGHIDFIAPTTSFPKAASAKRPNIVPNDQLTTHAGLSLHKRDSCSGDDFATPTCIREAYGITFAGYNYTAQPDRTTFAVYATEGATFAPNDLQNYLHRYNPPAAQASATYQVVGNGDPANEGGIGSKFETALDTQVFMGLAWPAKAILYKNGGVFGPKKGATYDNFVSFLQELVHNKTVPGVVSFSESMPENQMDPDYARRLCNMMAQVGARGVSLLFSSGNNGPSGDQPTGTHTDIFEPEWPASCPWVTSVGGTTDLSNEKAATKQTIPLASRAGYVASGGGFSNLFPRPTYQRPAVEQYVYNKIPAAYSTVPGFNPSGRGIPDVSAFSTQFPTVVNGVPFPVGGTSAATPTWAAIITLLNDYEAFHGRPTLGFLNPWLYGVAGSAIRDIVEGGNNAGSCYSLAGCQLSQIPQYGCDITEGWDPVTGLGSPKFRALVRALEEEHH